MTEAQLLGLWANMPRLEAKRRRRAVELSGARLSVDQVHDLVLAETEDLEQAQKAASDYAASLLRRGETPE